MFDKFLNKIVSRKLIVWLVATTALFMQVIQPEQWIVITGIYLSVQSVQDMLSAKTIKQLVDKVD